MVRWRWAKKVPAPSGAGTRAASALLCWLFFRRRFSYYCRFLRLNKQAWLAAGHACGKQGTRKMADPERIITGWRRHYILVTGKAVGWSRQTLLEERFHGGVG